MKLTTRDCGHCELSYVKLAQIPPFSVALVELPMMETRITWMEVLMTWPWREMAAIASESGTQAMLTGTAVEQDVWQRPSLHSEARLWLPGRPLI